MKTLIDTDVLSEARRPSGNPALKRELALANPDDLFISVITLGEITAGIAQLPAGRKRRDLEAWLAVTEHHFADRILPITRDIAQRWGELSAKLAAKGRTLHVADGLIAATASIHGLQLMTRNTKDFEQTGIPVRNPWSK
jgi:toxin FitB